MILKFKIKTITTVLTGAIMFCAAFSAMLYPSVFAVNDRNLSFPIIMYHHISRDTSSVGDYVITPAMLEQDLKYLKEHGYKSITVRELYSIDKGESTLKPKSIIITFDDGQESFYKYAFPLLKKYGFTAVFSIIGRYTDQFSDNENHNINYSHVTWEQMRDMANSSIIEFGNHSYNMHFNNAAGRVGVTQMKGESDENYEKALREDILEFNKSFERNMNFSSLIYTYPYGRFSSKTVDIVKQNGFRAAFTCYEKRVVPKNNEDWLYNLGRFNRSGKEKTESFFKSISVY